MKKENLPECPVEITATFLNDKWKILIMRDLLNGTKRFGELQRSVGNISTKVLTNNLRKMEEAGLLKRKIYPEVPPKVEYSLTETGESLAPVINSMKEWGINYRDKQR